MSDGYDPADDGRKSYETAIAAKRARGDTHYPKPRHNLFRSGGKVVACFRKLFSGLHGLIPFRSGKLERAK